MQWSTKFNNYSLKHLSRIFPIMLLFFLSITLHNYHKHALFHFANYWLDYIGCHLAIRNAWDFFLHCNPVQTFSHLIARTHSYINNWKAIGLNTLDSNINKIEHDIMSFEMSDCSKSINHNHLLDIYANYATVQRHISSK